ncbi:MAG: aminotransferase class III-fold pyridoxal phosphate-dependent enzyme [Actinomycetota bacterium]|nr:aminotransferase class III-fold pyridoxal phosphate-dependent enzyme [Actinomycetota bacterium]
MSDFMQRHRAALASVISFDTDIEAVSAQGLWVTDRDGKRYADFASGTAVTNLGHNHPEVVAAAIDQMQRLVHSGGVFRYESLVTAAEKLAEIAPEGIEKFLFSNAGAEAVEAAVKLAKHATGRQAVIAFRGGFHGRTMGSVTFTTSSAKYRSRYHPLLPSVFISSFPHPYRWGLEEEEATDRALDDLDRMFKHEVDPQEVACFLVEPVQGEGGYYPAPASFLQALREVADDHGIMLLFDEVQSGFGRTAAWFASDHYAVGPDIIALGKGIANGLPLAAVGASAEVLDRWPAGAHGTTFGGNPVSCAAAVRTIQVMEGLLEHARELSTHAFERFRKAQVKLSTIGDVRGLGLMIGVELVTDRASRSPDPAAMGFIAAYGLQRELIVISCGPDGNVIRFIPPLVTTSEELDRAIDTIEEALGAYEERR